MFESDCWLDWEPDPERACRDADPALEPYASLSKQELLGLMLSARGGREWEFLQEYFLDRCSAEELAVAPAEFIARQFAAFEPDELCFLGEAIERALRRRTGPSAPGRPVRRDLTGLPPSADRFARWTALPAPLASRPGGQSPRF
jgi:hypothetical protein